MGGVVGLYMTVPVTYTSMAVVVLTVPPTGGTQPLDEQFPNWPSNPLLNFNDGLNMAASMVIHAVNRPEVAAELGATPDGTTYKATNGATNPELLMNSPFVFIEGEAATAGEAREIVRKAAARARVELDNRQKLVNAPRSTYITMVDVMPPTTPLKMSGSRMRAVVVGLAVGLIMTLFLVFSAESFANARQAGKARRPQAQRLPVPDERERSTAPALTR
ncbi:hypothetical protein [Planomonospora venezuelensis]|uniref:Lipopolysaccharide biosynthesis protein n=1 Tax=Planomonospora venezuelensis TaxID=1999 RepID=A0A841CYT3_PLAVE|nr:hypothetical protein [Planomonospora venezuelensis]MBB5961268.1 hypothetical protein [Planomonospora venezuelensis]